MKSPQFKDSTEVVVVGAGLAGLVAAVRLVQAGRQVVLIEASRHIGGRALTTHEHGFAFNLGPHALYRKGPGAKILRQLEVPLRGKVPNGKNVVIRDGRLLGLPAGLGSLVTTGALGWRGKLQFGRLLSKLPKLDPRQFDRISVQEWIDRELSDAGARTLALALTRVTTYSHEPHLHSAGAAIHQLQLALDGSVLYLDGGWQSIVDTLLSRFESTGGTSLAAMRVAQVQVDDGTVSGVVLADGRTISAGHVILAVPPRVAVDMIPTGLGDNVRQFAENSVPVRGGCLTVGLKHWDKRRPTFALGLDRPYYYSVHSPFAKLAPAGGALIHLMRYLGSDEPQPAELRAELEGVLTLLQPEWRRELAVSNFLPNITVVPALDTAAADGITGRPRVAVEDLPGLWVAGDWVGSEGVLADASIASGDRAAQLILESRTIQREQASCHVVG